MTTKFPPPISLEWHEFDPNDLDSAPHDERDVIVAEREQSIRSVWPAFFNWTNEEFENPEGFPLLDVAFWCELPPNPLAEVSPEKSNLTATVS